MSSKSSIVKVPVQQCNKYKTCRYLAIQGQCTDCLVQGKGRGGLGGGVVGVFSVY